MPPAVTTSLVADALGAEPMAVVGIDVRVVALLELPAGTVAAPLVTEEEAGARTVDGTEITVETLSFVIVVPLVVPVTASTVPLFLVAVVVGAAAAIDVEALVTLIVVSMGWNAVPVPYGRLAIKVLV